VRLSWNSRAGEIYHVQYKTSPSASAWTVLSPPLIAGGTNLTFTDSPGASQPRYYRITQP
jgi:hypothetical protein